MAAHPGDTNLLLRAVQDGHPMQDQALQAIRELLARGEDIFPVAAMLVHGVTHIPFNAEDFRRYPGITVVHPHHAAPPAAPTE